MAAGIVYAILLTGLLHTVTCDSNAELLTRLQDLESTVGVVARQTMLQQFYTEEISRSDRDSGLLQIRTSKLGTRSYNSASHTDDDSVMSIHDHSNAVRTLGLSEMAAILNGIEFKTHHNDYLLKMKSTTSNDWDAAEDIPFPDVPPEVAMLQDPADQMVEMREWFRAWANQDILHRDYRPYFKPVLCYLEGLFTTDQPTDTVLSYDSDHHFLDASTWRDLQEKVRFTSFTGAKHPKENLAYVPSTIIDFVNETIPVLAQWNYRILCHPLKNDLPLNRLNPMENVKARMDLKLTFEEFVKTRAVRFRFPVKDTGSFYEAGREYVFVNDLMSEVPGLDGINADIIDDSLGETVYPYDSSIDVPFNAGFYHSTYRVKEAGAMGLKIRHRGFADSNMYVAHNTQPYAVGLNISKCDRKTKECQYWFQRWSYAIPLEIIYLTPLSTWNPYGLEYKGGSESDLGRTVFEGPGGAIRDGSHTIDNCYNGINSAVYYMTPSSFLGDEINSSPADTTRQEVCVLDREGNMHMMKASGIRIYLPNITRAGILRQRYPIVQLSGEGSGVWKEVDALTDMVLKPSSHEFMYTGPYEPRQKPLHLQMLHAGRQFDFHVHNLYLSGDERDSYLAGNILEVTTDTAFNHQHFLRIQRVEVDDDVEDRIKKCDKKDTCWDGHDMYLDEIVD